MSDITIWWKYHWWESRANGVGLLDSQSVNESVCGSVNESVCVSE